MAAKKACNIGDVKAGIEILGDLFVNEGNPVYLYNQGRCYEQNHAWQEAIDRFREYLRKSPNISKEAKAETEQHIAECKGELPKPEVVVVKVPETKTEGRPSPIPPPPSPIQIDNDRMLTAPVSGGAGLRLSGIVVGAFGLAGIATGTVLSVMARSLKSDLEKPTGYDRGKDARLDDYKTWGWVGYGVGAAALATGVTLYIIGAKHEPSESGLSLMPVLGPGLAGFAFGGTY